MRSGRIPFIPLSNSTGTSSSTINGAELIRRDGVFCVAANSSGCVIRNVDCGKIDVPRRETAVLGTSRACDGIPAVRPESPTPPKLGEVYSPAFGREEVCWLCVPVGLMAF